MKKFNLIFVIIILLQIIPGCSDDKPEVKGLEVIDGDTFVLSNGESVRLVGIDTQETGDEYAENAKRLLEKLLLSGSIRLEYDKQRYDRYGRTLAYVYTGGVLVNKTLLDSGLAVCYFHKPNLKYFDEFVEAQKKARKLSLYIWSIPVEVKCEYYLATKSSFRFHRPYCPSVRGKPLSELRIFNSQDEALDYGLSPCRNCRP